MEAIKLITSPASMIDFDKTYQLINDHYT
jgi:hypothetical protein